MAVSRNGSVKTGSKTPRFEFEDLDVNRLGQGIKLVSDDKENFTNTLANNFIELQEFKGERPLTAGWVKQLEEAMEEKTFRYELVQLAIAIYDGLRYRINGQHTCHARLSFQDDRSFNKHQVRVMTFECKTFEDLRNLYSVFDRNRPRRDEHIVMAQLVDFEDWKGISKSAITYIAKGFPLWKWEDSADRKACDTLRLAQLLKKEFLPLSIMVGKFLTDVGMGPDAKHLTRAPVVAAMIGTFNKNSGIAPDFWGRVYDGLNFDRVGDPRKLLRSDLMSSTLGSRSVNKKAMSQEEMYRRCILAWNDFRKDKNRPKSPRVSLTGARPVIK